MAALNTVYIKNPDAQSHRLTNDTGAILYAGEFTVIGRLCVVATEQVASAAVGAFDSQDGKIIQTDELMSGELTFGTVGQDVFFNPATGDFSDTATVGYFHVGQLVTAKDSDGMIEFIARRWAEPIESDET